MINTKDYDFSFSGLKTAVLYGFLKETSEVKKDKEYIKEMCFEIQQSIIDCLLKKTIRACLDYKVKTIMIGGGVCANNELRKQLKKIVKKSLPRANLLIPKKEYCTDNGLMVALAGYFRFKNNKKETWKKIGVNANLEIK